MSKRPVDGAEREKAIRERQHNVIVDAGAGTGKTTLLVARLLHLIAPPDDGRAFPLDRIAAITFTRKAAGELKLRLREQLLSEAGRRERSDVRRRRLAAALEVLDNASISTVHSFADRLLRLRPIDAKLSPAYDIADDPGPLVEETFQGLLADAVRRGLPAAPEAAALSQEARETVSMFQAAELRVRTEEDDWNEYSGLDSFVRDVIQTRDRRVDLPDLTAPNFQAVRRYIDELGNLVKDLPEASAGGRRLRRLHKQALRITDTSDVSEALRRAVVWSTDLRKTTKGLIKRDHFEADPGGWRALKRLGKNTQRSGKRREDGMDGSLAPAIVEPLFAHMANRLVRLRPIIRERYETVKRAHGVVDHIDLLLQLRDLLQRDTDARMFYQARFDHVLVDEFQDTDPLQAEIVMYICEAGAKAMRFEDIVLQPGKLTIVGDPKQSIYRFRRADIQMYDAVCTKIRAGGACEAQLTVNFRSAPSIIDWLNEGFDELLGRASEGPLFDPMAGTVRNVRLVASGKSHQHAAVHVLPFGDLDLNAEESRDVEGEALAHYLRYLVEDSALQIADPRTRELRRPRYGDIAIMIVATQTVHHLTSELDRIGVPHVVRGGTLFMEDPLHRQFILGLRALSDPGDGVAKGALRRPPFFAVSLEDLVRGRDPETRSAALQATETLITELRGDRHRATPGEVARHVLERTGFGRYVAANVNGAQRLVRLYELCSVLDELARTTQLDFDGVTGVARGWIDAPPRVEAPLPVDANAVQVITVHQAKGLEWPIVALWDGRASWRTCLSKAAFTVDATNGQWAVQLDGLTHDPSDKQIQEREVELRAAERKRVVYVAATRARDVLIIPAAGPPSEDSIAGTLLLSAKGTPHHRVAPYKQETSDDAWWKSETRVSMRPLSPLQDDLQQAWSAAAARAFVGALRPASVTAVAHAVRVDVRDPDDAELVPRPKVVGRHGPEFGSTVHRALQLLLERRLSMQDAVRQAAREQLLETPLDAVLADVARAHAALRDAGLLEHPLHLEYPVAGSPTPDTLVSGYVDLLVAGPDALCVIDFKTDAPPAGAAGITYPAYVQQVAAYAAVIARSGVAGSQTVRTGLLFTADGGLHWV